MDKHAIKITVLGAGISGLATAYWLAKDGFDITVLEAGKEAGGSMVTRQEDGFLVLFCLDPVSFFYMIYSLFQWLRHEYHPRTSSIRPVVYFPVFI